MEGQMLLQSKHFLNEKASSPNYRVEGQLEFASGIIYQSRYRIDDIALILGVTTGISNAMS